jgi:hypothetical protein
VWCDVSREGMAAASDCDVVRRGQVRVRLPRLVCAGCGCGETGVSWPSHCRSTTELNQLQARLSALMPYRVAADVLLHLLPIDAGRSPETLRSRTLQVDKRLGDAAAEKPPARRRRSFPCQFRPREVAGGDAAQPRTVRGAGYSVAARRRGVTQRALELVGPISAERNGCSTPTDAGRTGGHGLANCRLARKHGGRAGGCSMGIALSRHQSGPIQKRFTAVSG